MALATTPETAKRLSALGAFDVQVVSAAALSQEDLDAIETAGAEDHPRVPRFVCIARLNGRKGELLCLRAFRQAQISGAQLEIFGDGPERGALERFVRLRGLGDSVVFHGAVPRSSILGRLAGATALVHLSPEESGGFVCLEAMAAGVPPIVLTAGGPAELVPTGSGVRIDVSDVDTVVCAAAEAMRRLATDSEFQRRLGATGRRQVRQHGTWRTKIGEIESMYERILSAERVPSRVADGAASTGED
jgi:glycosyltransferase involved in cell wall biosynthesis